MWKRETAPLPCLLASIHINICGQYCIVVLLHYVHAAIGENATNLDGRRRYLSCLMTCRVMHRARIGDVSQSGVGGGGGKRPGEIAGCYPESKLVLYRNSFWRRNNCYCCCCCSFHSGEDLRFRYNIRDFVGFNLTAIFPKN